MEKPYAPPKFCTQCGGKIIDIQEQRCVSKGFLKWDEIPFVQNRYSPETGRKEQREVWHYRCENYYDDYEGYTQWSPHYGKSYHYSEWEEINTSEAKSVKQ